MSGATMTSTKASALLTRVQLNPEILTDDSTYVADLIQRAAEYFVQYTRLPRYPELTQGYVTSGASPSTDISGLSSNEFYVSLNGQGWRNVTMTLATGTSGAAIATLLQTTLRAEDADGYDEITVAYSTVYTVTSGRYGEGSAVKFGFSEDYKHVVQALKLAPCYGAVEVPGFLARDEADDIVVALTEILYRKVGIEGASQAGVPGDVSITYADIDPTLKTAMNRMRRLF